MKKFRATRPMRYNNRRLMTGDEFYAPPAHGRLFVAVKKAEPVRDASPLQPMPAKLKRKAAKKAKAIDPKPEPRPVPEPVEPVAVEESMAEPVVDVAQAIEQQPAEPMAEEVPVEPEPPVEPALDPDAPTDESETGDAK